MFFVFWGGECEIVRWMIFGAAATSSLINLCILMLDW